MEDATLREIAAAHYANSAQISVAWALIRPMGVVLLRLSNIGRPEENLHAAELVLSAEEIARIDSLGTTEGRLVSPETLAPEWD
jgi:diketogulonate reductase-like aldo/keto reductase